MRAIIVALALSLATSVAVAGVKEGDRAASIKGGQRASGKPMTLTAMRGKVVVLTFGASWCVPCKKELPALDKIAIRLIKKDRKKVEFIAVNLDDEIKDGKTFIKSLKLDCIKALYDPKGRVGSSWAPPVMPSTYVIDGKGIVRHVHKGYKKGDENKLESVVRSLLK